MTDEELKQMKERIRAAESAAQRVTCLTDAVRILESSDRPQILLTLNPDGTHPIRYRQNDDCRFSHVCWSEKESGLREEVLEAVLNVVRARYEKAIAEWRAI